MDEVRFNKEISAKFPQTILAYVADGFRSNGTNFQVLHLHTTNEHDRLSTAGTYYYDDFGDEVPLSAIKKFVAIDKVEQQMVETEDFLRHLIQNFKNMEYIGIKFVMAEPMNAKDAKSKGYRVLSCENEGYEVTYEDGYKSWCPKDVFELYNSEVKNKDLAKTAIGMVSIDYKKRFEAEYEQLLTRFTALKSMVEKWDKGELEFTPTCPREIYDRQLRSMSDYLQILIERAGIEKIELEGTSYKF